MDPRYYGLTELGLSAFGVAAFCWWQLRTLRRDRATTEARNAAARETGEQERASAPSSRSGEAS